MESQPSERIFFRLLLNFYMNFVSAFFYASFASLPPCRVCGDGLGGRGGLHAAASCPVVGGHAERHRVYWLLVLLPPQRELYLRRGITRVSTLPEGTVNSRRFSLSVFIVPLGNSARFSVPEVR